MSDQQKNTGAVKRDRSLWVYVGTYTQGTGSGGERSEGIYVFRLDIATGGLVLEHVVKGVVNPSFLALHPNRSFLYAVNETSQVNGQPGGGVSAFAIQPQTGRLGFINQQLSMGRDPCYLSIDRSGKYALVANYSSGNISLLPITPNGSLAPALATIQHLGAGAIPDRQEGPHAHAVVLSPEERFVFVTDLGIDRVAVYQLDREGGRFIACQELDVHLKSGSGPRHLTFHPNGRFVYLVNELVSSLVVYRYDHQVGRLLAIQEVSTLPAGYAGTNLPADVHVAPNGRFVYASNRGHDSLVIYSVDEESGRLTCIGHEPTGGSYPRNFALDPSGVVLLAANQKTGTITSFWIDPETGKLTFTGQVCQVPAPVFILFYQEV